MMTDHRPVDHRPIDHRPVDRSPVDHRGPDHRRGATARTRILAWILLVLTFAVVAIVLVTGTALFSRIDSQVSAELSHEAEKFRTFAQGADPSTGAEFRSTDQLLTSYLTHNVPEHDETFFSVIGGVADLRSRGEPLARLDQDPAFIAEVSRAEDPFSGRVDTAAGPAEFAVIPAQVTGDPQPGALVIVEFLAPERDEAWGTILTMSVVAVFALGAAGVAGWIIAGRVLAPIREVRETAARISETDLGRRIDVVGTDDVAQLATTFNLMLDRLEAAFDGQRRFLDDAGHELRTPITIIRGHLDVMGDDPAEREQTMRLVDDELLRMSRLVDDLIMLARSERPGFLDLAPVDLTDLVVETLAKATALAPRAWSIDAVPDAVAVADGQRLTQALVQLASNAVKHSGAGDAISLGCSVELGASGVPGRLRLWVTDSGAGVPEEDRQRIFDRFDRGSGPRSTPGSGLGLAIVARIAEAHGGSVILDSAPSGGATFTLDLPYRSPEEDA